MAKLPGAAQVDKSLRNLLNEVKSSLKQINAQAGKLLSKGDYAGAEALVEKARLVGDFQTDIQSFRAKWKDIRASGIKGKAATKKSALWEYYRPILKALVAKGGKATATVLEPRVEELMAGNFQPADYDLMGNRPRWKVMIKRARKHMVKEGFIEGGSGVAWRITKQGRKAAEETVDTEK